MLGHRIQNLLTLHGKRISDLARHCDVSPQAAHQWVHDLKQPKGARKDAIASFFGLKAQELEYGAILSLVPLRDLVANTPIHLDSSADAANLLVRDELHTCAPKSMEYQLGMRNQVMLKLTGKTTQCPFKAGTTAADAYNAGCVHAEHLIARIKI